MKNVSRNKLLLCFRPVMDTEAVLESERHDCLHSPSCDSVTSGSAHNKIGKKAPTSPESGFSIFSGESEIIPPSRRSLSRAVKATLFGTKRSENQQESTRSKRSSSMDVERRASMGLSDSSSSILPIETEKEEKPHPGLTPSQRNIKVGCSNIDDGLCLLLISLVITVWLGRFCAILFTSVWLYFIPRKTLGDQSIKLAPAVTRKERKSVRTKGDAWKRKLFADEIQLL